MYDIVIIGAGPAGLTAAVYGGRAEKSVLVLEKETFGGQVTHSPKIENYPGTLQMSGNEFAEKLIEQALERFLALTGEEKAALGAAADEALQTTHSAGQVARDYRSALLRLWV